MAVSDKSAAEAAKIDSGQHVEGAAAEEQVTRGVWGTTQQARASSSKNALASASEISWAEAHIKTRKSYVDDQHLRELEWFSIRKQRTSAKRH